MAEKWKKELEILFEKIEKDIGYDDACTVIKEKECEFTSRHEVNEIINACKGALKEHLEGRLQILNYFHNGYDYDLVYTKRVLQIGDLNINAEQADGDGWCATIKFNPPASSGRDVFAFSCDFGAGRCTTEEWEAQDFLDIMKIAGLYEVTIRDFLLFLDHLGDAVSMSWARNNEQDLDKFVKFESTAKSARSSLPPPKKQRME